VLDVGELGVCLEGAVSRFVDEVIRLWEAAQRVQPEEPRGEPRGVVDLAADPRPWDFPLRPANTNGSVLLDRFVPLLCRSALEQLGPELAIAMLTFAIVTDHTALWRRAKSGGGRSARRGKRRNPQ
jgi:hypothetical protein